MPWTSPPLPPDLGEWTVPVRLNGTIFLPDFRIKKLARAAFDWSRYWMDMRTDMQEIFGGYGRWHSWALQASTWTLAQYFQMETEGEYDDRWLHCIISGTPECPAEIDWLELPSVLKMYFTLENLEDPSRISRLTRDGSYAFVAVNYILNAVFQQKVASAVFEICNFEFSGKIE